MHDLSILFSTESIIVFILVLTRLTAMISTAPLFSTFPIPMQIKVGLSVLSAFIMYPFVLQSVNFAIPHDLVMLSTLLFKEIFIGCTLGFAASLIFSCVQIGGQIISMQMGLAVANALDPATGQNVPIVGQFYLFMTSIIFLMLNGHHWLFATIQESFVSLPMGLNFDFTARIIEQVIYFASQLFVVAFSIIMPIFMIMLVTTILMGFMSKVMPQMNVFMVAMPFKIYIGLLLLSMMMPATSSYLMKLIDHMLMTLHGIFI